MYFSTRTIDWSLDSWDRDYATDIPLDCFVVLLPRNDNRDEDED